MTGNIHRGPVVIALMLVSALIAAGLVRAGGTPPRESGTAPPRHQHGPAGAPPAPAKGVHVQGTVMTIVGEVMDPACYLEAGAKSIGPGHFQCAVDCARSGQTLAIYDREDDRIYFIAGELPGKNPNDPLLAFIHKKVDVRGTVYFRSGVYGIVILSVEPHQDKPAGAAAAPGGSVPPASSPPRGSTPAAGDKGAGK
jgi:hypothetical protein